MTTVLRIYLAGLLACLCLAAPLRADWINLTGAETAPNIAEIYVLDDRVRLILESPCRRTWRRSTELVPDDWVKDGAAKGHHWNCVCSTFAAETFQVVTESGEQLPARLELVEPRMRVDRKSPFAGMINPMTRQRVPEAPADKRVLYAEIRYPFEPRPGALTFINGQIVPRPRNVLVATKGPVNAKARLVKGALHAIGFANVSKGTVLDLAAFPVPAQRHFGEIVLV